MDKYLCQFCERPLRGMVPLPVKSGRRARIQISRGSYAGQKRKELDLAIVQVRYPGTRPLIPDVPQGVPPPSTMDYVESYLPYLMTSHKKKGEQYTYGQYLEKQIAEVIKMYKKDGYNTNQALWRWGCSNL